MPYPSWVGTLTWITLPIPLCLHNKQPWLKESLQQTYHAWPIWLSHCGMLPVIITSGSCSCRFTFAVSLLLMKSCWLSRAEPDDFCMTKTCIRSQSYHCHHHMQHSLQVADFMSPVLVPATMLRCWTNGPTKGLNLAGTASYVCWRHIYLHCTEDLAYYCYLLTYSG